MTQETKHRSRIGESIKDLFRIAPSPMTAKRIREFAENHNNGYILDVGSDNPHWKKYFDKCEQYIALDIGNQDTIDLNGDAHKLPLKDECIDTVLLSGVLEHTHTPQKVIDEAGRVLKTKGYIVISVPQCVYRHGSPLDFYRYTEWGVRHLVRNFDIIKFESLGGIFLIQLQVIEFMIKKTTTNHRYMMHGLLKLITPLSWLLHSLDKLDKDKQHAVKHFCICQKRQPKKQKK